MPTRLTEELLDTPIGKIQMFRGGAGAPLVYLHSAGGETQLDALDDLADSFDVLVPMFPGFGESEGIEQIDGMEDAVFHLLDLWAMLELDAPLVVGLSLGAWMAAELATRYPDHVGELVLINPVGLYIEGAPIQELFGRSPAELAEMLFVDQSHPIAALMHSFDAFTGDVGKQTEIPLEIVIPMWKALGATARLGWDPYLHNPKLRARLRRITAPTLVIAGARDGLVPIEHARTYAAEIPDARLAVIENGAHWVPFEQPGTVATLIREFEAR
ncbi:MAG TPA: alpha/beta hydrolase [Acidimicrobiia bacterium]|nr:alpha/beta hydrolase [Acidimicrobiia bacterium]